VSQQQQRRFVRAVQVVEHQQARLRTRRGAHELRDGIEEDEAQRPAIVARSRRTGAAAEQRGDRIGPHAVERSSKLAGRRPHQQRPQHLEPGPVRRRPLFRQTAADLHRKAAGTRPRCQLERRARLAGPRLAGQEDEPAAAAARGIQLAFQHPQQIRTPHETGAAWRRRDVLAFGCDHLDRRDQPEAAPAPGLDDARLAAIIAQHPAQVAQRAGEGSLADGDVRPHGGHQFGLRNHAVAVFDQGTKQSERLGLDRDRFTIAEQARGGADDFPASESEPNDSVSASAPGPSRALVLERTQHRGICLTEAAGESRREEGFSRS
jgi:hypothetical protein